MRNSYNFGGSSGISYEELQFRKKQALRAQNQRYNPRTLPEAAYALGHALKQRFRGPQDFSNPAAGKLWNQFVNPSVSATGSAQPTSQPGATAAPGAALAGLRDAHTGE